MSAREPAPADPRPDALRTIPRLDAEQWRRTGPATRWLIAVRAPVLVMTFSAAAFGGLLAWFDAGRTGASLQGFDWLLCCLGLLLAHAANNLLNDYTDTRRGLDDHDYFRTRYGTHVLIQGLVDPRDFLGYLFATGGVALAVAGVLLWRNGPEILPPLLAGACLLLLYTWPLKQWGLGELAVLLVWGPLMVGGTHLVTSGGATAPDILLPALLFGAGPTLVILGKHLDKLDADTERGMRTLPVRLGEARTRHLIAALALLQYPLLIGLVLSGRLPGPALLMLGAIPTAIPLLRMSRCPRPAERPEHWPEAVWPLWFAAAAFRQARLAGVLLLLGMAGGVLL
ncbi:MAG: prenyltransferase [Gammaproteobacteria bacterium]|nr:prenyltransferase [Gammaproteobacteria bacterium]